MKHRRPTPAQSAYSLLRRRYRRFVEEMLLDPDHPERAARIAGFPEGSGRQVARRSAVQALLRVARSRIEYRTEVEAAYIVRRWKTLADADPNELVQLRQVNCRYCNGVDHRYQHTLNEQRRRHTVWTNDRTIFVAERRKANPKLTDAEIAEFWPDFDEQGGDGYDRHAAPNPDCPECRGDGEPHVIFKDTRYLSPSAQALYNGVEVKGDGSIRVLMRDRQHAEDMLAKHLGLAIDRREVLLRVFDPSQLSDEDLVRAIEAAQARMTIEHEDAERPALTAAE